MRYLPIFLCCLMFQHEVIAQGSLGGTSANTKFGTQVTLGDAYGRPLKAAAGDINGSQYFNENYRYSDITMVKGRKFTNVKAKIDLTNQSVVFLSNDIEAVLEPGSVRELSYRDTTENGIIAYRFRTGYPAVDNKTPNNFYIVLADGKCSMLRSVEKRVTQRKNEISGEVFRDYETTESYFLFSKGEMKHLKKDKDFILSELADKQAEVNKFILENKLNLKNYDHIARLLDYYNGL